jgi:ATP-binding cassette subfamily B protein
MRPGGGLRARPVGAIVLVAAGPHASAASAILVLTAGARLSSYVGATVSEIGFARHLDGRIAAAGLAEDYASATAQAADR